MHLYEDARPQREVATLLGVSQPRVAQMHAELLSRGRTQLVGLAA